MRQEDKELLLKDLCTRLPYRVIIEYNNDGCSSTRELGLGSLHDFMFDNAELKPYLRSIFSMTEEEFTELKNYTELKYSQLELVDWDNTHRTIEFYLEEIPHYCVIKVFDWFNAHHFDYRGLIEKGLALEAQEGMYKNY